MLGSEGFFGSGVLWMLLTYPAYWVFQWLVEGEPFALLSRRVDFPGGELAEPAAAVTE